PVLNCEHSVAVFGEIGPQVRIELAVASDRHDLRLGRTRLRVGTDLHPYDARHRQESTNVNRFDRGMNVLGARRDWWCRAYRWFCGLSIADKIPDHSVFSRAGNERFRDSNIFRRVFEQVVETCIAAGFVGGEGFAVDASLIVADANKQRSIPRTEWNKERAAKDASRAVKEYLATLDDAAFGAASEVTPKFVSPSDPAAQWTGAMRGPAFFAYADNYLVDLKFGVIVDVQATRAIRQAEVGAVKTMIGRTEERFGMKPERLAADTAYGSAA